MLTPILAAIVTASGVLSCADQQDPTGPPRFSIGVDSSLTAIADTYVDANAPNFNRGSDQVLRVRPAGLNRALVRFDQAQVAGIVGGDSLASATLLVTVSFNLQNWGSGQTVDLHRLATAWTESGATWNCATDTDLSNEAADCSGPTAWTMGTPTSANPWVAIPTATRLVTDGTSGVISFDVTSDVRAHLAGTANHGWILKRTVEVEEGRIDLASRESATNLRPRLVLAMVAGGDTSRPAIPAIGYEPVDADSARTIEAAGDPRVLYYRDLFDVRFDDSVAGSTVRSFFSRYQAQILGGFPLAKAYTIRVPDLGNSRPARDSFLLRMNAEPGVRYAAPLQFRGLEPIINGRYPQDGSHALRSSWFDTTVQSDMWSRLAIHMPQAWGCENGDYGTTTRVGVVDFAFDLSNPDLSPNVAAFHPVATALAMVRSDSVSTTGYQGHGTGVTGVLAARGNNGMGIAGVLWNTETELFALGRGDSVPKDLGRFFAQTVLPLARSREVRVLNLSIDFGGPGGLDAAVIRQLVEDAVRDYVNAGNLLVSALPNVPLWQPASYFATGTGMLAAALGHLIETGDSATRGVIVVAGTTQGNQFWDTSAAITDMPGSMIAAPATHVTSLIAQGGGTIGYYTGNSFAAPLVAGTAGLLWAMAPQLSGAEVKDYIFRGAQSASIGSGGISVLPQEVLGAPAGVHVFQLNAYQSLVLLANERSGLPVCGSAVGPGGLYNLQLILDAPPPAGRVLATPDGNDWSVSVAQGGRLLSVYEPNASTGEQTRIFDHLGNLVSTRSGMLVSFLEQDTVIQLGARPSGSGATQITIRGPTYAASPSSQLVIASPFGAHFIHPVHGGSAEVAPSADRMIMFAWDYNPDTTGQSCGQGKTHSSWFSVELPSRSETPISGEVYDYCAQSATPGERLERSVWSHDGRRALLGGYNTQTLQGILQSFSAPGTVQASAVIGPVFPLSLVFSADDSLVMSSELEANHVTCRLLWRRAFAPYDSVGTAQGNPCSRRVIANVGSALGHGEQGQGRPLAPPGGRHRVAGP